MRRLAPLGILVLLAQGPPAGAAPPPHADYCRMLAREIEGRQHAFLAGNHLYYIGGSFDTNWRQREHETIGLTHPFFRDGRARGFGIATGPGGTGHDKFGWEFWHHVRGAWGTVVIGDQRFRHPRPKSMVWRPDRVTCTYLVGGATITEVKFISRQDVACTILAADRPVEIEFEGRSFVNTDRYPTFDGDRPGQVFSQARTAKGRFDEPNNAIHITEGGTILTKPEWKHPAVVGRTMYDGMSVVVSSSQPLAASQRIRRDEEGRQVYSFRVACGPDRPAAVTYAMGDDYADAAARTRRVLADPQRALAEKTDWLNSLLNTQIPYFRCSDAAAVRTYYYLWSLYFMYFTQTGNGYEAYPHTQTAVNNFMGLHLWDSWVYAAMGCWVVDKWDWGFGNVLSWKAMVPFKNRRNALPDNFGVAWHSPGVWMNLVGAVEFTWDMYARSQDRRYLAAAYDELFRPLYWDNDGPQRSMGIELNALESLIEMARALGRAEDVRHWEAMRPGMVAAFRSQWGRYRPDLYAPAGSSWKDIWHLASMMCRQMPPEWVDAQCDRWVMNTETGFLGPVALRIRPPDCPPNGVFAVSTISTWLAVEGMFRHHRDWDAVFLTLNHLRAMNKDYGFPVAPECWDPNGKPWGSQYYNWDGPITDLLLRRLAGVSYSLPADTFTVCEHLPEKWDFVETHVPVVRDGRTEWVRVRIDADRRPDGLRKTVSVAGCPLKTLVIEPWLCDREALDEPGQARPGAPRGHRRFVFESVRDQTVTVRLGKPIVERRTLAVVTPPGRAFASTMDVTAQSLEPGARLHFTTDGSDPNERSPICDGPIRLSRTTTLKLRAYTADGEARSVMPVAFTKAEPVAAQEVANPQAGLTYHRYEGKWNRLPRMEALMPAQAGVTRDFDVARLGATDTGFALRLAGYIRVPADGLYTFHVKSDDGSRLRIAGRTVVELDVRCARDAWQAEGTVALRKGFHPLVVEYFQAADRMVLELAWDVDGGPRRPVGSDMLFHTAATGEE